ncbi:MAG: aminotransferase class V-fold PLP-dependent enzyme [Desulfitobacteriia bacterium]|jgi:cysteine desulfurase family protein
MKKVYADQAATSFPKAPGVGEALKYYVEEIGANINRGVYGNALSAEETVLETREILARLFNYEGPENVIFTLNITQALNILIKGTLKPGDHCIVSSLEHNAVMRPLFQLKALGVDFTRVKTDSQGFLNPNHIKEAFTANTKAVILTHASNVCGTVFPLQEIGALCREKGAFFIVDSAQTAGAIEIDMQDYNIDALAFTGHKSLLGPQGIGGFVIQNELAEIIEPLFTGGTGSLSASEEIPTFLPDKFEAGTPNIPGIFGLHRALHYLEEQGLKNLHSQTMKITEFFLEGIKDLKHITLIGPKDLKNRTAVVSLDFPNHDNGTVAYILEKNYGIMTRSGLHCSPSAHQTLGTFPDGTVRFSFNHSNTVEEVEYIINCLQDLKCF